jgi:voltage-gated potassium channel
VPQEADPPTDQGLGTLPRRRRRRLIIGATLRTFATVAAVLVIYYAAPMGQSMDATTIAKLAVAGVALLGVLGFQLWRIKRSRYPAIRAAESLAFTIPVYVLLFATVYFLMNHANGAAFGTALSRTDAMYFSIVVFTTVGFGDITAKTEAARLVVTGQMMLDLLILGLVLQLVVNAIKIGQQRHAT